MEGDLEIQPEDFTAEKISVVEPFSQFLQGSADEWKFDLTLLDVARFSGHACPSVVGAFLIAKRVVKEFDPDTETCVRGEISVEIGTPANQGATGPMANVFGFIFGAWAESGFGGLQGQFARRNLLRFSVPDVSAGSYRFRHLKSGACVEIQYQPSLISVPNAETMPFQQQWRRKIKMLLQNPDLVLKVVSISDGKK